MKVLATERLNLRHMTVDDAAFMLALLNSPTWLRYIGDRGVKTLEEARIYIQSGPVAMVARYGFGFHVVELKETGQPIGVCGLAQRDYLDDVDIGFALLPEYAGKGYAYEAALAVLQHAKDVLGLRRVVATTHPDNLESAGLLMKLGLRFERMIMHPAGGRELKLFGIEVDGGA